MTAIHLNTTSSPNQNLFWARWQNHFGCTAILILIAIQFVLFRHQARTEIVDYYPTHYDQAGYLLESYLIYEKATREGWVPTLFDSLTTQTSHVRLFSIETNVLFAVFGPSRLTALGMNFVWIVLLQLTTVWILLWLTKRWSIAFIGLGMILLASTTFMEFGGLMDFRTDFATWCQYGILIAFLVRSDFFRSLPWSLAVGGILVHLLLFRTLMSVYMVITFCVLVGILCASWMRRRGEPLAVAEIKSRLLGMIATAGVVLIFAGPFFIQNFPSMWNYYVVGHITGEEGALRKAEVGVTNRMQEVMFYPDSLVSSHLGRRMLNVVSLISACGFFGLLWVLRSSDHKSRISKGDLIWSLGTKSGVGEPHANNSQSTGFFAYACVGICMLTPLFVLSLNPAKSPLVASIMVPAFVWLVLLAFIQCIKKIESVKRQSILLRLMPMLALLIVVYAAKFQYAMLGKPTAYRSYSHELSNINELYEIMYAQSREHGWRYPILSVNRVTDMVNSHVYPVLAFEKHGKCDSADQLLGKSLYSKPEAEIFNDLDKSDFVVLLTNEIEVPIPYPFDQQAIKLYDRMADYCKKNMVPLKTCKVYRHQEATLYIRLPEQREAAGQKPAEGVASSR